MFSPLSIGWLVGQLEGWVRVDRLGLGWILTQNKPH